jgi:cytochrome oxidase assembly protein ShyY1
MFRNIISTDSTAINFMYSRLKKKTKPDEEKLQMTDFYEWELEKVFRLWGVDPGVNDAYLAADGERSESHESRCLSTAEYYVKAGYKKNLKIMQKMKMEEGISVIESQIPTHKVSSIQALNDHLKYIFHHLIKSMEP